MSANKQCEGHTKSGNRCKRKTLSSNGCPHHKKSLCQIHGDVGDRSNVVRDRPDVIIDAENCLFDVKNKTLDFKKVVKNVKPGGNNLNFYVITIADRKKTIDTFETILDILSSCQVEEIILILSEVDDKKSKMKKDINHIVQKSIPLEMFFIPDIVNIIHQYSDIGHYHAKVFLDLKSDEYDRDREKKLHLNKNSAIVKKYSYCNEIFSVMDNP